MPHIQGHVTALNEWIEQVREVVVVDSESLEGTIEYIAYLKHSNVIYWGALLGRCSTLVSDVGLLFLVCLRLLLTMRLLFEAMAESCERSGFSLFEDGSFGLGKKEIRSFLCVLEQGIMGRLYPMTH